MKLDISQIDFSNAGIHKKYDQSFVTRYVIVAELVKEIKNETGKESLRILDLGGYNGVSRQLLPDDKVTILDVFDDDKLEDYIQVDSVGIPQKDNAYDIVISTDTLEHIPAVSREKFIDDAVRVASVATIIAAPFEHQDVGLEESLANNIYLGQTGSDYSWLQEHRDFSLPTREWMEDLLSAREYSYARFSHSNLRLWGELIGIGFFIANNIHAASSRIARRLKLLNAEYFKTVSSVDFPEDGYRTVYVVTKSEEGITVKVPEYDEAKIRIFTEKCHRSLGVTIAEMSREIYKTTHERNEAYKENERLVDIEKNYINLVNSRGHRLIASINRIRKK